MKRLTVFCTVLALLLSGCLSPEEKKLQQAIKNYNANLVMALKSQNPEMLKPVATGREIGGFSLFMARLMDEKKIMVAQLLRIEYKDYKIGEPPQNQPDRSAPLFKSAPPPKKDKAKQKKVKEQVYMIEKDFNNKNDIVVYGEGAEQTAEVKTTELWEYSYLDADSRQVMEGPAKVRYQAVYFMEQHGDKWLVADINFKEEEVK